MPGFQELLEQGGVGLGSAQGIYQRLDQFRIDGWAGPILLFPTARGFIKIRNAGRSAAAGRGFKSRPPNALK